MPLRYQFLPVLFLITAVLPASADPITLVSVSRSIYAQASANCCAPVSGSAQDQDFMALTVVTQPEAVPSAGGSALLESSVQPENRFFYGTGTVSTFARGNGGIASANDFYSVVLDLSEAQHFYLGVTFDGSGQNAGDRTAWSATLSNENDLDAPVVEFRGSDAFNHFAADTLPPGRYNFTAILGAMSTEAGGAATGGEDFRLEFSDVPPAPTPEPASLLLLGSGAMLLFARRGRFAH